MTRSNPLVGHMMRSSLLTSYDTYAHQPALSDIPRVVAGSNRLYYELVVGKTLGDMPCSPENSVGTLGENHMGGYMGKPLRHTWWSKSWSVSESSQCAVHLTPPTLSSGPLFSDVWKFGEGLPVQIWVPPSTDDTAYVRPRIDVAVYCTAYSGASTAYVSVVPNRCFEHLSRRHWAFGDTWLFNNYPKVSIAIDGTGWHTGYLANLDGFKPGGTNQCHLYFAAAYGWGCTAELGYVGLSQAS